MSRAEGAVDYVTIEVDGSPLKIEKGRMLIEATDGAGVYVPRFCYHSKLSVAANCRMCLVEVERAPKPLPACATPVAEGMKVRTRSPLALEAQRSMMEFLLINHPLDCPICDQGGECELQDLALGYGNAVSRYQEKKRVVKDQDIGPLVRTDMTRCIHCTRCVRFGEEIAGLRELGATGRGEFMEIGTYVAKSMVSELSGNVIDLCPVGALTSKPFRYSARAWEMTQRQGVAPHDLVGSNVNFHVRAGRVKRVAPAENEAVNEVWLSDRDRFSYEGLYAPNRLETPMIKLDGAWREVEWDAALDFVKERLEAARARSNGSQANLGALASPSSTTEELYLAQKLLRGLGANNIDHRLRQADFSDQDAAPVWPGLGLSLVEAQELEAVLVVGGFPRKDQPLLNHRLRKAALAGAEVMALNPVDFEFNYPLARKRIVPPAQLARAAAAVLKAASRSRRGDAGLAMLSSIKTLPVHRDMVAALRRADKSAVFIGGLAMSHPQFSLLRYFCGLLAERTDSRFGYLSEGANAAGAWLAGAVPHRLAGGEPAPVPGLDARAMLEQGLRACLLLNAEPELDFFDGGLAREALAGAEFVVSVTGYKDALDYADAVLPMALHAENEGSFINPEGRQQVFTAAARPPGQARRAWKVFCDLARRFKLSGFDYEDLEALRDELPAPGAAPDNLGAWQVPEALEPAAPGAGLQRIGYIPMNAVDPLARHAPALQQTADCADNIVRVNAATAAQLELADGETARVEAGAATAELPLRIDETVPEGCALLHGACADNAKLGPLFGGLAVTRG